MGKSTRKNEFYLAQSFQQNPCWEMDVIDVMPNVNFALSSNNKDQLRDLYNYLTQKVMTVINTLDGSTFKDNLITSHQVEYMSSVLNPAGAVENEQEHYSNKVGSLTSLV